AERDSENKTKRIWQREPLPLEEVLDFDSVPTLVKPVATLFMDYRVTTVFHHLLSGFLLGVKNLTLCVVIAALDFEATTQVLLVMLAEIFYFGHTLVCNIKVSLSLRIVDVVTEALMIVYLIFK